MVGNRDNKEFGTPKFNLMMMNDAKDPKRYHLGGSVLLADGQDPYLELRTRLDLLIERRRQTHGATVRNRKKNSKQNT